MTRRPPLWRPVSLREQSRWQPLSRRTVLRGLLRGAAISIALPPLEAFFTGNGTAYACGGAIPRRFGLFFWGNGNLPSRWVPSADGADWPLSEQLLPLANVKDLVSVVSGLSIKLPNNEPHTSGLCGMLCAAPPTTVGTDLTVSAPTIDQVIASAIGGDSLYRSIQTAATECSGVSYNGPSSRNPVETSPYDLFDRLFGDTFREPGSEGIVDPTLALRRSVLDAVGDDVNALKKRLGTTDRQRLDQHLEGIRELEQRLAQLEEDPPNLEACERPAAPEADYPDEDGRPQYSARSRAMVDLLTMTLACDLTRVFGHYIDDPVGDVLFPGRTAGHHSLTHDEPTPQDQVNAIVVACMEEFAYLVEKLDSVVEADGTLLDNCAVLATSEVSEGRTHSIDDMPMLIAGRACGALLPGIHYRSYTQDNATSVLVTLARAMDIPMASFGVDEAYCDDSLSAIEA